MQYVCMYNTLKVNFELKLNYKKTTVLYVDNFYFIINVFLILF